MGDIILKLLLPIMSHYNYVHAGIEILSMSKRIMNRVFDVSSDCGVKIDYQDTDSIPMSYDDVDKTVGRFKENMDKN